MRKFALVAALFVCSTPAFAWNCSDPLAARVPVAAGTTGTYGSGDGQLFLGTGSEGVKGQLYECETPKPTDPTTPSQTQQQNQSNSSVNNNSNSNSNVNSAKSGSKSTSSSLSGSTSQASSTNTLSANPVATATGGNASALAQGGQGGAGGSSTASSSNNSTGNQTSISSNETVNIPRQTPLAYSPDAAFTTSPCIKGFSGGASFPMGAGSIGISKVDKGCDSRQTAVIFHAVGNDVAAALILCSTDASKRAHLTIEQCSAIVRPAPVQIITPTPTPVQATVPPTVVVVPMPAPVPTPVVQAVAPTARINSYGTCLVSQWNACLRNIDRGLLLLQQDGSAKMVLAAPLQSGVNAMRYLHNRGIASERVELRLSDENEMTVDVFSTGS